MGVDVKGIVFLKNDQTDFEIADKIKSSVNDFYKKKLVETINGYGHDEPPVGYRIGLLNAEDKEKFSMPQMSYLGNGAFNTTFAFKSDIKNGEREARNMMVLLDITRPHYDGFLDRIGSEMQTHEVDEKYTKGIMLSLGSSSSAPEIIQHILKDFGNKSPAYLVRNDCADSYNEENKNVVKVGNFPEDITTNSISEKEYKTIREKEVQDMKKPLPAPARKRTI